MSDVRWEVYSDLIPLSGRPKAIGEVTAPDKATALERAAVIHGSRIVVQSAVSRKCADREITPPLKALLTRDQIAAVARLNAKRARRRKERQQRDLEHSKTAAKSAAQPLTSPDTTQSTEA